MASSAPSQDRIADFLLAHLNIRVSGGCGTQRNEPLECMIPEHQSYRRTSPRDATNAAVSAGLSYPDGVLRTVDSAVSSNGMALVYDKDVRTLWRLPGRTMAAYEVYF